MSNTTIDRIRGINSGIAIKAPCRVRTTANITLSGLQTIDGVALAADDRVLVMAQSTQSENGIYKASTGSWVREPDFDGNRDIVNGTLVYVTVGTLYAESLWAVSSANPITVGTTSITFIRANIDPNTIPAGDVNGPSSSVDSEIALFDSTTGKLIKRATGTGYVKVSSGVAQTPSATVPLTDLATQAANSIVANATASTAAPTAVAVSASQLVGRGSTGNIAPITLGTNLSMSGATLNAVSGATVVYDQTVTTQSNVDIAGLASYKAVLLTVQTTAVSVGLGLYLRFSTDNGSTFITSSDYAWQHAGSSGGSSASDTSIHLGDNTLTTQRATIALISNLNNANGYPMVMHAVNHTNPFLYQGMGYKLSVGAVNAIRILTSSGTFSGRVTVLGW